MTGTVIRHCDPSPPRLLCKLQGRYIAWRREIRSYTVTPISLRKTNVKTLIFFFAAGLQECNFPPRMKRANYGKAISHGFAFFFFFLGKPAFAAAQAVCFEIGIVFFLSLFSYPSFPIGTPPPSSASKFEKREKKSPAVLHPFLGIFAALKNVYKIKYLK